MKALFICLSAALPAFSQSEFRPLFNGRDLSGWSPVLENAAPGKDPQGLVTVHDETIHMYQNVKAGDLVPFGFIVSEKSYSRYHLRFQYQWGGKKFAPRTGDIRDAGTIYHAYEFSKVWPSGIENQVQEGDTGDLIWCDSNGLTWMRPAGQYAPEGQGLTGLLPENGGLLRDIGFKYDYIGRFQEFDNYEGWTTVDTIVQADEWAIHKINGRVHTRLRDFKKPDGTPLTEGRITLQLEGAEIQYRNVAINELPKPLKPSLHQITLMARQNKTADATVTLTNSGTAPLDASPRVIGKDGEFFTVEPASAKIAAGASAEFKVHFAPLGFGGRYSAAVQFGDDETGAFVPINAISFGDGTEPTLQEIVDTLSVPAIVGKGRWQEDKTPRLGDSIHARSFISSKDGKALIMPVAAFPDDDTAIPALSLFTEVDPALKPVGAATPAIGLNPAIIAKSQSGTLAAADYHEFITPDSAFGLCLGDDSSTNQDRPSKMKLRYKARVFKASRVLETKLTDSYLICFETGGLCDYNDAIFLLANVLPWKTPEPWPAEEKRWTLKEIGKALALPEQ
ncbi:MAG: family 16 glycoside hydrolase [Luteolibacter sp.]|uniref:family 16 glycoside hydrolase n=1 Tax=Luteolibacter sp. TaxID=1962973 RepID=UPI00326474FD